MATPVAQPMKSTWHDDRSKWDVRHYLLSYLDVFRSDDNFKFPVFKKTDPVPFTTTFSTHRWVITHAAWPMLIHWGYYHHTGTNLPAVAAIALYSVAFQVNTLHLINVLGRQARYLGFLDGDKTQRDRFPDAYINKGLRALPILLTLRSMLTVFISYRRNEPFGLSWWLPVELFGYSLLIDFWFYIYHRSCHEIDGLWQYHRTHHLTKHPTPLLSIYADVEQEAMEVAIVPVLSYVCLKLLGLPMGFYDWWVCHQFIVFTEVLGHSGLRAYAYPPGVSSFFLKYIGCALVIEDHDMHHRHGWKKSTNYGKQTLFWDMVFGTRGERIEMKPENVDFTKKVSMPWI